MRRDDGRPSLGRVTAQEADQPLLGGGIEPAGRLVQGEERRVGRRDRGRGHQQALTRRQIAGVARGEVGDAQGGQPRSGVAGLAARHERRPDLLLDGVVEQQRVRF